MSGSISLSMSQQFDEFGKPLAGGLLYTIEAGTTSTPQNSYQDSGLTLPWPNPIILDAAGRVPQFYLADGSIKIRLTDSAGVQQLVADNILVVGPSSGSGGGGSVDATTVLATGDLKVTYGTGTLSGFVRANGRTIGSSTSGATERANADWTANKTLTLPDFRSRALAGLGDMGNSDNALFSGVSFASGNSTTLGSLLGAATKTIAQANLPSVNFAVTIPAGQGSHNHAFTAAVASGTVGSGPFSVIDVSGTNATQTATLPAMSGSAASGGSGTALQTVSPYALVTFYLKL